MTVTERKNKQLKKEIEKELKQNESISDALTRIKSKIDDVKSDIEGLENELVSASDELEDLEVTRDNLIQLKEAFGDEPIPAKHKTRSKDKKLDVF